MNDGKLHDVIYVCTMANNIWAFDANDGKPIWKTPTNLGKPIKPNPAPHPGFPTRRDIDLWGVNILWGILGTPVIDHDTNKIYVVVGPVPTARGTKRYTSYMKWISRTEVTAKHGDSGQCGSADYAWPTGRQVRALASKTEPALLLTATSGAPSKKTLFVSLA